MNPGAKRLFKGPIGAPWRWSEATFLRAQRPLGPPGGSRKRPSWVVPGMDPRAKRLFKGPKGPLGPERSDFFKGPKGPLGLGAKRLFLRGPKGSLGLERSDFFKGPKGPKGPERSAFFKGPKGPLGPLVRVRLGCGRAKIRVTRLTE